MPRGRVEPPPSSGTPLDALAAAFRARTIPHAEWTHTAHLRVGAWHVQRYGADKTLAMLRIGIQRLNEAHGTPNSPTSGYHETITRAYVELLAAFLGRYLIDGSLDQILNDLLASRLAHRNALLVFYSRDYLFSAFARLAWAEPDIAPLSIGAFLSPLK